jgi:hypothetical protein
MVCTPTYSRVVALADWDTSKHPDRSSRERRTGEYAKQCVKEIKRRVTQLKTRVAKLSIAHG